ncbi:MBL fold metallo-hydrolase [Sulfolobus sp. E5-1-F]|uniref:MBL fold metallo-hydrolase n=1 Tax=Sulfolobaceae TaxID=118883 RepID=UPI001296C724|nr:MULTISPECIES: MBL fold metallo-hydrolase [unclassified Sulfolobus]QGA53649.1 MBL fold metallo-hydrolase [Sulfolobus sp. E5-1-F]QGA68694.1 MBL fold metallo-hydrolase [Sulfolobus sp. E11-6]
MMIYTLKLPMQGPLKYINAYLVKDNEESILIDTGLPTQEDIIALTSYLKVHGFPTFVLITHYHPDHMGLVRLFKDKSNILISEKEYEYITYLLSEEYEREMRQYFLANGFPEEFIQRMLRNRSRFSEIIDGVNFNTVKDGDVIKLGQEQMRVLLTPGHTMGHICLVYEKVIFSGDHILQDVTPNVSLLRLEDNPLKAYLESLDRVEKLNVEQLYPAHGEPFKDVSKRVEEIKEHHKKRLEEIINILRTLRRANGFDIASRISWYKKWDELSTFDKQLAMGETLSHIKYLVEEGFIKEINVNNSIYYAMIS